MLPFTRFPTLSHTPRPKRRNPCHQGWFPGSRVLRIWSFFLIFAGLVLMMNSSGMELSVSAQDPPRTYVAGELVVRFRSDLPQIALAATKLSAGVQTLEANPVLGLERVAIPAGQEQKYIAELRSNPLVAYVGPNYIARIASEPNDTSWWRQWNLRQIHLPAAWQYSTGSDLIIAIIDTGVDLSHPEIAPKLVEGYNFLDKNLAPGDDHGHGTHVAGIAAAVSNNRAGIAGVSWGARIMPLKVLSASGEGSYFDIASAIQYAADEGAKVINLSLGGSSPDPNLLAAVRYARDRGCVVVAAAGNQGGALLYPAAYSEVLAVAATTDKSIRPTYSNYGQGLDVAAPGGSSSAQIYGLAPGGGYTSMHGTSMAAPHVAGLAALIWSMAPEWTPSQVESTILETATKTGTDPYNVNGWNQYLGYGQIHAGAALQAVASSALPTPTPTPAPTATPVSHTQQFSLLQGWNLISLNVQPPDGRIEVLTASLADGVEIALGFDCTMGGMSYYPDLPASLSTLHVMEVGRGYWLKMRRPATWQVTGTPARADAALPLCSGWNLVGYLPANSVPIDQALASLGDSYEVVLGFQNGQGLSYYSSLPSQLNSLTALEPGLGYWVRVRWPGNLVYPTP